MYEEVEIQNIGAFGDFRWTGLGKINVLIGENDSGKTYLLKLLYALSKAVEEYQKTRDGEAKAWREVLANKLKWVFQPPGFELGRLVKKGERRLSFDARLSDESFHFSFGRGTTKEIRGVSKPYEGSATASNSGA